MITYRVILITPNGDELLFATDSLKQAKQVFDKYASKGIAKGNTLRLDSIKKIRSLYVFEYVHE